MKTEIAVEDQGSNSSQRDSTVDRLLPLSVVLVGFALRLTQAKLYFLNPDEALHYLLASEPSVGLAYKAALTNAHPPLLILMLYYWRAHAIRFGGNRLLLDHLSVAEIDYGPLHRSNRLASVLTGSIARGTFGGDPTICVASVFHVRMRLSFRARNS